MKFSACTMVAVLLMFASACAQAISPTPPFGIRVYNIGPAPDFVLKNIDGENFSLHDTRGRWVFLHFWASWCGPCREEMPTIRQLAQSLPENKLQIVMINTAEDEDTIFSFMASLNMEPVSLLDLDGQITETWKPRGLPTTFLIDPQGQVRYQAIGGRDWHKPEYIDFLKSLISAGKGK